MGLDCTCQADVPCTLLQARFAAVAVTPSEDCLRQFWDHCENLLQRPGPHVERQGLDSKQVQELEDAVSTLHRHIAKISERPAVTAL